MGIILPDGFAQSGGIFLRRILARYDALLNHFPILNGQFQANRRNRRKEAIHYHFIAGSASRIPQVAVVKRRRGIIAS
jgi:hypothetical protein